MARLTPAQQAVYALGALEVEVNCDGWQGYFFNAEGNSFPEALAVAELAGSQAWTRLLRDAEAALPGGYTRNIDDRQRSLLAMPDGLAEEVLGPLDRRLYAMAGDDFLEGLLERVISSHPHDFFLDA